MRRRNRKPSEIERVRSREYLSESKEESVSSDGKRLSQEQGKTRAYFSVSYSKFNY